jgi:hypothetical protein
MGYYGDRQSRNVQGDFWRGYNSAKKKDRDFQAGKIAARIELLRGVLRLIQIMLMVAAMIVILRGCDRFVALQ